MEALRLVVEKKELFSSLVMLAAVLVRRSQGRVSLESAVVLNAWSAKRVPEWCRRSRHHSHLCFA